MRLRTGLLVATLIAVSSCTNETREITVSAQAVGDAWVLLVPDWKNDVVHRVSSTGEYEGDFLDPARTNDASANKRAWRSPRGVLLLAGEPSRIWVTAEKALSEWNAAGAYQRIITADTTYFKDPAAITRVGEEIFVFSQDKSAMLVFDATGERIRMVRHPELDRATDCKLGPDGLLYVSSSLKNSEQPGLVSIWDPNNTSENAEPVGHLVSPDLAAGGTTSVQSLVFDDDGNLLITELASGRIERWDVKTNSRSGVLIESGEIGGFKELERGPDGLMYVAGSRGIYRFDSRATAEQLRDITPFFPSERIGESYAHPFSPQALVFVPLDALDDLRAR